MLQNFWITNQKNARDYLNTLTPKINSQSNTDNVWFSSMNQTSSFLQPLEQKKNELQSQVDLHSIVQQPLPTLNFWAPMSWKTNFQTDIAPKVTIPSQQQSNSNPNFFAKNVKPQPTQSLNIPWIEQTNADNTKNTELSDEDVDMLNQAIENWFSKDDALKLLNEYKNKEQPTQEQTQPWFLQKLWESYIKPIQTLWEELIKKPVDRLLDYAQGRDTDPTNTYTQNDIWKTWGAALTAWFNAVTPWLTAWLNVAWSTDLWGKLLSSAPWQIWAWAILWKIAWWNKWAVIWWAIWAIPWVTDFMLNNVPWLKDYYNSLDESWKEGMKGTISGLAMLWAGSIAWKAQWKNTQETINILNKIPENVAHWIIDAVKTMPENVKQIINNLQQTPEQKISKADTETIDKIRQAIRPSITWVDTSWKFEAQSAKLLQWVKEVVNQWYTPKNAKQAMEAINESKQKLWQQVQGENRKVNKITTWDEIAQEIYNFTKNHENDALFRANPELEWRLSQYADSIKENPRFSKLTQDDLQELLTNTNQKIPANSFLKQLDSNPIETQKNTVLASLLRDKVENNLMDTIWSSSQELRNKYGSLRQLEKDLAKRYWVYARQNPKWLADLFWAEAIPEIAMGIITGNIWQVAKWVLIKWVTQTIKNKNNPNNIIKDIFATQAKIKGKVIQKQEPSKLLLPPWKTPNKPIITPQTVEKWVIQESKIWLPKKSK